MIEDKTNKYGNKSWAFISPLISATGILAYFFFVTVALGQIKVVDADTIILKKEKIRLHGIDAPGRTHEVRACQVLGAAPRVGQANASRPKQSGPLGALPWRSACP